MDSESESSRQSKPRFDPTINYGHVLTASSFIMAGKTANRQEHRIMLEHMADTWERVAADINQRFNQ